MPNQFVKSNLAMAARRDETCGYDVGSARRPAVPKALFMFDPYRKWLGIRKDEGPPTHYQLLGIAAGEDDVEIIEEAAIRQATHVRAYQIGPHAQECTRLLNEISQARTTLTNPAKRKQYDATLAQKGKLAGPTDAGQTAITSDVAKAATISADLDDADFVSIKKRAKAAAPGSKKLLIYLAAGGGLTVALVIGLIVLLSGKTPDNQQAQNTDKAKAKQNPKKDQTADKDALVKPNKDKVDEVKKDVVKKDAVKKDVASKQSDKELAAKFVGRYNMSYSGAGSGKARWQFTPERAIQDGNDKGTWRVEDGKVIVTYSQEFYGQAILEFKGDNNLVGRHRQTNGQVFLWLLTRDETPQK